MLQSSCRDPTFAISKSTKLNFNGLFVVDHDGVRAETYVYRPDDGEEDEGADDSSVGIEDSEELQKESVSEEDIDLNSSDSSWHLADKKDGLST